MGDLQVQNGKLQDRLTESHQRESALQALLTAADERADSEAALCRTVSSNLGKAKDERDAAIKGKQEGLKQLVTAMFRLNELQDRANVLEGLLKSGSSPTYAHCAAVMEALKPAECCTVSAKDRALLQAGDYTPEELFGIGGKPSCPKCAKPKMCDCNQGRLACNGKCKAVEGGGDGSTCNQIREESGLPTNHPCQACGHGACIDR